jgi:hypothetical protein
MTSLISRAPASINFDYMDGPLLTFECTQEELLARDLIEPCDVPKVGPGSRLRKYSRVHPDYQTTYLCKSGLVRLTVNAHLIRHIDVGFVDLLAGLVALPLIALAAKDLT